MFEQIDYRKIEGFGWYVVTYLAAKKLGFKHYATEKAQCARGHRAPFSVERTKCIKCLAIEARNKDTGMSNERAFEFWRRKLKLPKIINPNRCRYVYVVENIPYTKLSDAASMVGIPETIIFSRCEQEAFPDYQKIPTKYGMGVQNIYCCDGREYTNVTAGARGEGIKPYEFLTRITSPKFPTWIKKRLF